MKKLIFLTNYENIIPQRNNEIEGLNLDLISKVLLEDNFETHEVRINNFIPYLKEKNSIEGVYFFMPVVNTQFIKVSFSIFLFK